MQNQTTYATTQTFITCEEGMTASLSFDAWGTRRNSNWTTANVPTSFIFDRGFTSHEHLDEFGLINMNGRVYDDAVGRFLSPDPFVQMPDNAQNFNRYSYCLNNPLIYTDPSGEFFIIDSWLAGLFSGGWKEANKRAMNDIKIWGGLFVPDPNKWVGGMIWERISRFTWQLPQTIGGFFTSQAYNTFGLAGGVESVDYLYGATVLKTRDDGGWGITQGSYIIGGNQIEADANNPLFQHEYGHYIQSQKFGLAYYSRVGIPSIRSAMNEDPNYDHDFNDVEQDANRRAFIYFNKNVEGFQNDNTLTEHLYSDNAGWDFDRNPLNINGSNNRLQYIDYRDIEQRSWLNNLKIGTKWYDYASWGYLLYGGPIWAGLYNAGM